MLLHQEAAPDLRSALVPEQAVSVAEQSVFRYLPFLFEGDVFPSNLGAVIQRTVLTGVEPAREVVHDADGSWLVGDGVHNPNNPGAAVANHLWHAIERKTSIAELASMPPGHMATRDRPGDRWVITPCHLPDDE
jgi:hypothetical protein